VFHAFLTLIEENPWPNTNRATMCAHLHIDSADAEISREHRKGILQKSFTAGDVYVRWADSASTVRKSVIHP
jgi:hypothetical protein